MVKSSPELFSSLVIMNTGIPDGLELGPGNLTRTVQKLLPFVLWRSSVSLLATHLPVRALFRRVCHFSDHVANAYDAPFPNSSYKAGAAKWPLLVPLYRDDPVARHMTEAKSCLSTWKKPALIMFGDKDPITKGQDKFFVNLIPHSKHVIIKGASHFLQETHGEELSENIVEFLQTSLN